MSEFLAEVHLSTNTADERSHERRHPTKDDYLGAEKRLGAAEYALAGDVAAGNKALDDAVKAAREDAESAIGDIRDSRSKTSDEPR